MQWKVKGNIEYITKNSKIIEDNLEIGCKRPSSKPMSEGDIHSALLEMAGKFLTKAYRNPVRYGKFFDKFEEGDYVTQFKVISWEIEETPEEDSEASLEDLIKELFGK